MEAVRNRVVIQTIKLILTDQLRWMNCKVSRWGETVEIITQPKPAKSVARKKVWLQPHQPARPILSLFWALALNRPAVETILDHHLQLLTSEQVAQLSAQQPVQLALLHPGPAALLHLERLALLHLQSNLPTLSTCSTLNSLFIYSIYIINQKIFIIILFNNKFDCYSGGTSQLPEGVVSQIPHNFQKPNNH